MKRLTVFAGQILNGGLRSLMLVCLVALMSWLMIANQPAYAAKADPAVAPTQEGTSPVKQGKVYDTSMKVVDPPRGERKFNQETLRQDPQTSQESSDEPSLVEKAKELVDGFTPGY